MNKYTLPHERLGVSPRDIVDIVQSYEKMPPGITAMTNHFTWIYFSMKTEVGLIERGQ